MTAYSVTVKQGKNVREIIINANTPEIARRQGRRFGTVLHVGRGKRKQKGGGMSTTDRYTFMVRLSTMLASKVSTTEALRLIRDSFSGAMSHAASNLLERCEMGIDLTTAISEDRKNFPGAVGLIVKVGAQSGQTWRALQEAADFERKTSEVKRMSSKGLGTALGSFFIAGVIMIGASLYVGPKIQEMSIMQSAGDTINTGWVDATATYGGILMVVLMVIMGLLFWLATVGRTLFPIIADKIIMKIPMYSDMVLDQDNYINLHRLSLLVRAGVRMEEALKTSYDSAKRGALKEDLGRSLIALRKGEKWATGMKTLHPTDRAALMLASDRDQIATNLENLAAQYQNLYIQRISVVAPTLQVVSALALSMSGIVLFGQTVLPMLQLSAGIINNMG